MHHGSVQRLIGLRAKHLGKVARLHLAQHHIGIRYSQRAAAAVAGRARVGTGALRAHPKARTVKRQNRAATRCHGVDAHHRRAHAHAGDLCLELALKLARVVRHIGRRATHVKANDLLNACNRGGAGHTDNAARGATQNRVFALKRMGVGKATRRLHEVQRHTGHVGCNLIHIAQQNG